MNEETPKAMTLVDWLPWFALMATVVGMVATIRSCSS